MRSFVYWLIAFFAFASQANAAQFLKFDLSSDIIGTYYGDIVDVSFNSIFIIDSHSFLPGVVYHPGANPASLFYYNNSSILFNDTAANGSAFTFSATFNPINLTSTNFSTPITFTSVTGVYAYNGSNGPETANITQSNITAANISVSPSALLIPNFSYSGHVMCLSNHNGCNSGSFQGGSSSNAVPEPSTWLMTIFGFGAIGLFYRRNRGVAGPAGRVDLPSPR
jgi:hypothetical protein